MLRNIFIGFLAACALSIAGHAQSTATPVIPGYLTTSGCPSGYTSCFSQYGAVPPVTQSAVTPVAGTQTALSIATATSLTIPATATEALIQAQGTNNSSGACLFWRDDGTAPTGTTGQLLSAGTSLWYNVTSLPVKLIAATSATCAATISYYK